MYKYYVFLFLKGLAMGAVNKIPGVSGGTVAFVTGIYEELIDSISKINFSSIKTLFKKGFYSFYDEINGKFFTYIHDLEPYKDVDFIIIDGPDQRVSNTEVTLNLELFVKYLKKEIPYFMDGRSGSVDYYKDEKGYKLEVVDIKKEGLYQELLKEYNEDNI